MIHERKYTMNADQYRRANTQSFFATLAIFVCGFFINIFKISQDGFGPDNIAIMIAIIVSVAIVVVGRMKYSAVKLGSVLIMGGATIFYIVLLLAETNLIFFAFGLPILICSIVYLNVKLCRVGILAITASFAV